MKSRKTGETGVINQRGHNEVKENRRNARHKTERTQRSQGKQEKQESAFIAHSVEDI